jgi:hypothetical protein
MPRFRATVWVLSGVAEAVEGYAGLHRYVAEREARSAEFFKADIMDDYINDLDAEISFGPITEVDMEERERKLKRLPKRGFSN